MCIYWDSVNILNLSYLIFCLFYYTPMGNFEKKKKNVYTLHLYNNYTDQKAFITFNGADSCHIICT